MTPFLTQGTCAVYLCGSALSQATCASVADDLQSILNSCTTGSTVRGADVSPSFPGMLTPRAFLRLPTLLQLGNTLMHQHIVAGAQQATDLPFKATHV